MTRVHNGLTEKKYIFYENIYRLEMNDKTLYNVDIMLGQIKQVPEDDIQEDFKILS